MVWGAGWEGGGAVGWVTPPILGRTRSVGGGRPRRIPRVLVHVHAQEAGGLEVGESTKTRKALEFFVGTLD